MSFAHPWILLGLWLVPLFIWWWLVFLRARKQSIAPFLDGNMARKLAPADQALRFKLQCSLILAGFALAIAALSGPRWGERREIVMEKGRDVVVAVDVSRSMLARDVRPNRLLRAKADVMDLIRSLRGDRAALVAFRGNAVTLCPLTTDYAYLEQTLDGLDPDSAPRGATDIGDAIEKAASLFDASEGGHRAIVLITDGEDLAGRAVKIAEQAKEHGIVIFTVGLGDPAGAVIPTDGHVGSDVIKYQGQDVISKMDGETLQKIAEITGGAYVPVGVRNVNLGSLYSDHLAKLAARDIEESLLRRAVERYQWFLFPAVLALVGAACLSRGRLARARSSDQKPTPSLRIPNPRRSLSSFTLLLIPCLCCLCETKAQTNPVLPAATISATNQAPAIADSIPAEKPASALNKMQIPPGIDGARIAQAFYKQGRFQEAEDAYRAAAKGQMPAFQNLFFFNAGCAAYEAGNFKNAAALFKGLEANSMPPEQSADARHNLGCSFLKLADAPSIVTNPLEEANARVEYLEQAGAAFQGAVRAANNRTFSRDNLAVVTQALVQAREQARVAELMARYGNQSPPALADRLLSEQRAISAKLPAALSNATPERISLFENIADDQSQTADIILPLKSMLLAAGRQQGADQKNLAELAQHLDAVEKSERDAAGKLRDLDETAALDIDRAGKGVYLLWKSVASHDLLLNEDLLRQTNAIISTRLQTNGAPNQAIAKELCEDQAEAQNLTELFVERFVQTYPEATNFTPVVAQSTPSGNGADVTTNQMAMTPEKRKKILDLAAQAAQAQHSALQAMQTASFGAALPTEEAAYAMLKEIQDLLPKDKNQQNQQQQQQNQQQNQQDQQKEKDQQQEQQQDKKEQQQDQKQDQKDQQDQPNQEHQENEPKQAEPEEKSQQEMAEEQARSILLKAIQREKEHKEEQRRQEQIPMSPVDRDW